MKERRTGLSAQSTLLEMLQAGCTVEFPNGARMRGNPHHGDIDLWDGRGASAGFYGLNEEGLGYALLDPGLFPRSRTD